VNSNVNDNINCVDIKNVLTITAFGGNLIKSGFNMVLIGLEQIEELTAEDSRCRKA